MERKDNLQPPYHEGFEFRENEKLFDRVSHERFVELIEHEKTIVHKAELSSNNYGEFLFVTASRPTTQGRAVTTFWGYGHHDYRERWLHQEWFFYQTPSYADTLEQTVSQEEVQARLTERLEEIGPYLNEKPQTEHGRLFEMLADMLDEDGALIEIEDMEAFFDDWDE